MREIEFRGKRIDNSEWVYGDLVHKVVGANHRIMEIGIQEIGYYPNAVIPETVGQYTGLKDRNGTKIYQGDIIKGFIPEIAREPERKGIVKWGLYGWIVDFKLPKYESGIGIVGFCSFRNYEVIGNIHDNPELSGGGK